MLSLITLTLMLMLIFLKPMRFLKTPGETLESVILVAPSPEELSEIRTVSVVQHGVIPEECCYITKCDELNEFSNH